MTAKNDPYRFCPTGCCHLHKPKADGMLGAVCDADPVKALNTLFCMQLTHNGPIWRAERRPDCPFREQAHE